MVQFVSCFGVDFLDVFKVLFLKFRYLSGRLLGKKVQVGKDQEKAQSEKDSHSKNRGGKNQTNNQVHIP